MFFSLDVRRARKGDCLLLHFGSKTKPGLVLIDGGPSDVYQPHLKPRLLELRKAHGIDNEDQLPVDLLMLSHNDDDHAKGLLDLTKEELSAQDAHAPKLINVSSFWHNSFDAVVGRDPSEVTKTMASKFGKASKSGAIEISDEVAEEIKQKSPEDSEVVHSGLKVLASIEQGYILRERAEALNYPLLPELDDEFDGTDPNQRFVVARKGRKPIPIAGNLKFTVVGPMLEEIKALQKKHDDWLKELKKKGKSPPKALATYIDKSITNLSSIVVIAEVGKKSILLTGDARGDKIIEGLQLIGRLKAGENATLHFNVIKVPHHGSSNNLETGFFERLVADHYVFSGNGQHGNPEREAIEMLWEARGDDAEYTIHLTYPVKDIDSERKLDFEKSQKRKVKPHKWSPKNHSLTKLLQQNPSLAAKIKIVPDKKPHVINLIDVLPY